MFQHCVAIVHVPRRRPFSQNLVQVYKDGHLVKEAPFHCPSLSEVCQAGFGGPGIAGRTWTGWGLESVCPAAQASDSSLGCVYLWGSLRYWMQVAPPGLL